MTKNSCLYLLHTVKQTLTPAVPPVACISLSFVLIYLVVKKRCEVLYGCLYKAFLKCNVVQLYCYCKSSSLTPPPPIDFVIKQLQLTPEGSEGAGCVGNDMRGGGCWVTPTGGGTAAVDPATVVIGDVDAVRGLLNLLLPRPLGFMLSPIICLIRKTAPVESNSSW